MPGRLSARGLRAVLGFSAELQAVERLADLPDVLLPALLRLVDADLAGWNDIDLATGTFDGYLYPDQRSTAAFAGLSELEEPPPLLAHFERHPQAPSARISDVCDRRTWHASPAYVEVYRHFGIEAQIAFPVTTTPTRIGAVAMNRARLDFSDTERDLLDAVRPQVEIAHHRLVHGAAREAAIGALGPESGWIMLDDHGTVVELDPVAAELLDRAGVRCEPGSPLPRIPAQLAVRRLDGYDGNPAVLAVRNAIAPQALGLTARQYDALLAVADGATVAAAARRLDISPQTLATHLRDAYAVLGVSGRLAAINVLREHGLVR
jgi:DNA-binding CsgD family transcriptional regulator